MKKKQRFILVTSILVLLSTSLIFIGNRYGENSNITNVKKNITLKGDIHAELEVLPFEQSVNKSDLIVEIQILEKLKEINEPTPKTIYRAEITDYLNNEGKNDSNIINIMQGGNSEWTLNKNKLFSPGEKYILFLVKTIDFDIENTYWILGEETSIYEVNNSNELIKWAHPEAELSNFEDKVLTKNSSFENVENSKVVQVLDKDLFKKYIANLNGQKEEE